MKFGQDFLLHPLHYMNMILLIRSGDSLPHPSLNSQLDYSIYIVLDIKVYCFQLSISSFNLFLKVSRQLV